MTPLPRPKPLAVSPLQPGLPTMYDLKRERISPLGCAPTTGAPERTR